MIAGCLHAKFLGRLLHSLHLNVLGPILLCPTFLDFLQSEFFPFRMAQIYSELNTKLWAGIVVQCVRPMSEMSIPLAGFLFIQLLPPMCQRKPGKMAQVLDPCHPCGRPRWNSRLLTSAWPRTGHRSYSWSQTVYI